MADPSTKAVSSVQEPSKNAPMTATVLDVAPLDHYLMQLLTRGGLLEQQPWLAPLLLAFSVLSTATTPATRLLGLQFNNHHKKSLLVYAALLALPSVHQHLQTRYQAWQAQPISNRQDERARHRHAVLWQAIHIVVDRVLPVVRLGLVLACWSGRSSTPSLALAAAGLGYGRASSASKLHVDYAHRRWMLLECLAAARVLLAGWSVTAWSWPVTHWTRPRPTDPQRAGCRLCHERAQVPVQANCCRAVYCYHCLYQASLSGSVTCRDCQRDIATADFCRRLKVIAASAAT